MVLPIYIRTTPSHERRNICAPASGAAQINVNIGERKGKPEGYGLLQTIINLVLRYVLNLGHLEGIRRLNII